MYLFSNILSNHTLLIILECQINGGVGGMGEGKGRGWNFDISNKQRVG